MKTFLITITVLFLLASCSLFPGPRNVDWKKEWSKNQVNLKELVQDILVQGDKKYTIGDNDFPKNFSYPFDEGFMISNVYGRASTGSIDAKAVTIIFFIDRGVADHYSAIFFTNDTARIKGFDEEIQNGSGDVKIEHNWYMINN